MERVTKCILTRRYFHIDWCNILSQNEYLLKKNSYGTAVGSIVWHLDTESIQVRTCMDGRGKRTHDLNEGVVTTTTTPEKATQQHYEWLRPRPRGWYYTSSGTSTLFVLVQLIRVLVRVRAHPLTDDVLSHTRSLSDL